MQLDHSPTQTKRTLELKFSVPSARRPRTSPLGDPAPTTPSPKRGARKDLIEGVPYSLSAGENLRGDPQIGCAIWVVSPSPHRQGNLGSGSENNDSPPHPKLSKEGTGCSGASRSPHSPEHTPVLVLAVGGPR